MNRTALRTYLLTEDKLLFSLSIRDHHGLETFEKKGEFIMCMVVKKDGLWLDLGNTRKCSEAKSDSFNCPFTKYLVSFTWARTC